MIDKNIFSNILILKKIFKTVIYMFVLMIIIPLISFLSIKITNRQINRESLEKNEKSCFVEYENEIVKEQDVSENNTCENNKPSTQEDIYLVYDNLTGKKLKLTKNNFLRGIVAAEMPAEFHEEALKAQAIAANSFYMYKSKEINKKKIFEINSFKTLYYISEDQMRNRWKDNYEKNMEKIKNAVEEVCDKFIVDSDGNPILALFHAMSPGITNSSEDFFGKNFSYLTKIDSQSDKEETKFINNTEISLKEFKSKVKNKFNIDQNKKPIKILDQTQNKLVKTLEIYGTKITGKEFRNLFGLQSQNFEVKTEGDKIILRTFGRGHGVGLSQHGANYLAKNNYDYKQILEHYYPGTNIN